MDHSFTTSSWKWSLRGRNVTKISSSYGYMQMDPEIEVANSVMSGLTYIYNFFLVKSCFGKRIKHVFVSLFFFYSYSWSANLHGWCGSNFGAGGKNSRECRGFTKFWLSWRGCFKSIKFWYEWKGWRGSKNCFTLCFCPLYCKCSI